MSEYTGTDNLEVMSEAVNYNTFLLSLLRKQLQPRMRILEVGAGIGTFAQKLCSEGYDVICFEPDINQAKYIQSIGLRTINSLEDVELSSFDFIYSLNVLEHIEDDQAALKQWYLLLKSGGSMLIYIPAFQLLFSSMDRKVGHYRRYTKKSLIKLINKVGGQLVNIRYVDSLGFFASLVYKYKNDGTGNINRFSLRIYDSFIFPLSRIFDFLILGTLGKNVYVVLHKNDELS